MGDAPGPIAVSPKVINDLAYALCSVFLETSARSVDMDDFLKRVGEKLLESTLESEIAPHILADPIESLNHAYALFENTNHAAKIISMRHSEYIIVRCERLVYWDTVERLHSKGKKVMPQFMAGFAMAFLARYYKMETKYISIRLIPEIQGIETRLQIIGG
jgi:hypothetical protein